MRTYSNVSISREPVVFEYTRQYRVSYTSHNNGKATKTSRYFHNIRDAKAFAYDRIVTPYEGQRL